MLIQKKLNSIKNKRGFTLVELMIVVAIIGVLAALAIYGVRKYLTNAKTAEARTALGRIAKDAQSAWERENMPADTVDIGETAENARALCPDGAKVPSADEDVENKKYQSAPADWTDGAGWQCLKFTMDGPQYFQYTFDSEGTGEPDDTFTATANGDGNSLGQFSMDGRLQQDATTNELILTVSPTIREGAAAAAPAPAPGP